MYYAKLSSPIGNIFVAAGKTGLISLHIGISFARLKEEIRENYDEGLTNDPARFKRLATLFDRYFKGERVLFKEKLELIGTPFQRRVWAELSKVPYGKTVTYAELAGLAGSAGAYRAVGSAMRANPLPIVIPCHRVVGSNGKLGGYSAGEGIKTKMKLLELEGTGVSEN